MPRIDSNLQFSLDITLFPLAIRSFLGSQKNLKVPEKIPLRNCNDEIYILRVRRKRGEGVEGFVKTNAFMKLYSRETHLLRTNEHTSIYSCINSPFSEVFSSSISTYLSNSTVEISSYLILVFHSEELLLKNR